MNQRKVEVEMSRKKMIKRNKATEWERNSEAWESKFREATTGKKKIITGSRRRGERKQTVRLKIKRKGRELERG